MMRYKSTIAKMIHGRTTLAMLLLAVFHVAAGQPSGVARAEALQNNIYEAYVLSDIPLWETTLGEMESMYARVPSNAILYDILLAQYGLIGYYLGTDQKTMGRQHLDKAEEYALRLSGVSAYQTTSRVFQSAFLAFRINLRPMQAVRLGPRSYRLIEQAMESDPGYARVWVERGNAAFYTPSMFGGDRAGAVTYYQEAVRLFERNMQNNHRWLYLSTLVALANAQRGNADLTGAIQTLEKTLRYEPRFKWVRDELLPEYRQAHRR